MPNMLYSAPRNATFQTLSPAQYASLLATMKSSTAAMNLHTNGNSGTVSYQAIDFAWTYDGQTTLSITIEGVHNPSARLMGNMTIFEQLNSEFLSTV